MKRNAIVRIILWSIVLAVLLAVFFGMLYVPGAGRSPQEDPPAETWIPVPLTRVPDADGASVNAVVTGNQNVHNAPDPDAEIVAYAERGTKLQILRQEQISGKKWGYIGAPTLGWIDMKYVQLLEAVNTDSTVMETTSAQVLETTGHSISLDAASIRDIQIEWAAGSIKILPREITEIRITEEGADQDKHPMIWKVQDGKLSIQYAEDGKFPLQIGLNWDHLSKDLVMEVPIDWHCDSLEIDAAAASLEVTGLNAEEVEFDGASGRCVFDNCSVEKLDLDTASGDVHFSGSLNQLDCDSASANILLELDNIPRSIDLDTASGDLEVVLPADAGFTVTLDAMSSEFQSDFDTVSRNGSYVAGNGRCRIDVDAMSGDVTVRKGA